tara:strand:+ start:1017 stop:1889 length:873 start_codon:yes stop_codon:yes gene_type:complete
MNRRARDSHGRLRARCKTHKGVRRRAAVVNVTMEEWLEGSTPQLFDGNMDITRLVLEEHLRDPEKMALMGVLESARANDQYRSAGLLKTKPAWFLDIVRGLYISAETPAPLDTAAYVLPAVPAIPRPAEIVMVVNIPPELRQAPHIFPGLGETLRIPAHTRHNFTTPYFRGAVFVPGVAVNPMWDRGATRYNKYIVDNTEHIPARVVQMHADIRQQLGDDNVNDRRALVAFLIRDYIWIGDVFKNETGIAVYAQPGFTAIRSHKPLRGKLQTITLVWTAELGLYVFASLQ